MLPSSYPTEPKPEGSVAKYEDKLKHHLKLNGKCGQEVGLQGIRRFVCHTLPQILLCYTGGSEGKESVFNSEDPDSIPGLGRSPERKWQTTPVFLPGEFHGQRSLVVYSPCHKEPDMIEQLILHFTSLLRYITAFHAKRQHNQIRKTNKQITLLVFGVLDLDIPWYSFFVNSQRAEFFPMGVT